MEGTPLPIQRALLLSLSVGTGAMLAWAAVARVDVVAVAEGRLVPSGYVKVVQPGDGGIVRELLVKDGDSVREGQLLVRLDERSAQADSVASAHDLALKRLAQKRIDAELRGQPFRSDPNDPPSLVRQVQSQWQARRLAHADALAQEAQALEKLIADARAADQVRTRLAQTAPLARQTADSYRKLVSEGFMGEVAAVDRQREAIEHERNLDAQVATVAGLQAQVEQQRARLAHLQSQYRTQLEGERLDLAAQINRAEQEQQKARLRTEVTEVRAPHAGIVKDLAVATRGAVVAVGAPLLSIVPADEPLLAEVWLANEDAGFVAVGQPVRLKVLAFPFQRHGLLEGRVGMLGADATDAKSAPQAPPTGSAARLAYRALVHLPVQHLDDARSGSRLRLTPGMAVNAEVVLGSRTVLEYLLSPLQRTAAEAARER